MSGSSSLPASWPAVRLWLMVVHTFSCAFGRPFILFDEASVRPFCNRPSFFHSIGFPESRKVTGKLRYLFTSMTASLCMLLPMSKLSDSPSRAAPDSLGKHRSLGHSCSPANTKPSFGNVCKTGLFWLRLIQWCVCVDYIDGGKVLMPETQISLPLCE